MTESEAFAALVAARRNHDAGAMTRRDPAPLARAIEDYAVASGVDLYVEVRAIVRRLLAARNTNAADEATARRELERWMSR